MSDTLRRRLHRAPLNVSRVRLREFAAEAAAVGRDPSFRVLDAGAGKMPYRDLFAHVTYEAADVVAADGIDYVCDLAEIPVPDASYDLVFCSQTLEHVMAPVTVLRELRRVLKPGGEAWLTAPLFYPEHMMPWDYHRYTRFAWRKMARRAGFVVEDISWLEGYYATLSFQLQMAHQALPRRMRLQRLLLLHISRRMAELEMREKYTSAGMPKNYRVRLRKPHPAPDDTPT